MLKSAEKSMTPKLRLSDVERNISLSCILKLRLLGNFLMIISTQMMEAPMMHAAPLTLAMTHPRSSFERPMFNLL